MKGFEQMSYVTGFAFSKDLWLQCREQNEEDSVKERTEDGEKRHLGIRQSRRGD